MIQTMDQPITTRLKKALAEHHAIHSAAQLSRASKVSEATVSNWLNNKVQEDQAKGVYAVKLARALNIRTDWLLVGDGQMRNGDRADGSQEILPRETPDHYVRFPLLEGFAGMGRGDYVGDHPEIVDFVEVTREWASQKLRGVPPDVIRVITGRGDSMRGQYSDGDLVFLDSRIKWFDADSAYCYRWNGQVQIKRLQLIGPGRVRILSKNPDYPPIDVGIEDLEIGGRAIAAWTLKEF